MKRNPAKSIYLVLTLMAFSFFGFVAILRAQDENQPLQTEQASQQVWSADQLDNLVAPVALYPDPLLSQIFVASTYPLEVVEAGQWLQQNKGLQGQALVDAAKQQPWDSSVQALVAIPDALDKLNQDIRWTTDLGNAFLSQESDVMNAVQRMRERAQADGRLVSTPQQQVITREQGGQQIIVIEPAEPDVIYVPVYDPSYIWGPPLYGYYPPLYYPSFGFSFGIGYDLGYCYVDWGGWNYWGWGPNWSGRTVFVNSYFFNHYGYHHRWAPDLHGREVWVHNPVHRLNVPYANAQVAARFGRGPSDFRNPFRAGEAELSHPEGRFSGRAMDHGDRGELPRRERNQNTPGQRQFSQEFREGPRVVPFANHQAQLYQAPRQYRPSQRADNFPRGRQFQVSPQQRFEAPRQFHPAPQMSFPRFGNGGFSHGFGGGSFNGGNHNQNRGGRHR